MTESIQYKNHTVLLEAFGPGWRAFIDASGITPRGEPFRLIEIPYSMKLSERALVLAKAKDAIDFHVENGCERELR